MAPVVTYRPEATALQPVAFPELPEGGAIVKALGCGLCGTDAEKIVQQKVPVGIVLGHEAVGEIHTLHAAYTGPLHVGQRIALAHHVPCGTCHYCLNQSPSMCMAFKASNIFPGGFSPYYSVSAGHLAHTVFPIEAHISDREAFQVEPLACVLRAIRRAGLPHPNSQGSAMVIGLGYIGMLLSQVLHVHQQTVFGVDLNPRRTGLFNTLHLGQQAFTLPHEQATLEAALQTLPCVAVDAVYLSVVNHNSLALAQKSVRNGGTIIVMAGHTEGPVLDPAPLYYREINLITSYSPAVEDLREAHTWIQQRRIALNPLITHPMPIEHFNEGLELYRSGEALKVFFHF
jgi:L-iditol 2-dehydrogenase